MDPNLIKQLMQSLQSALQILQTAQQSSGGDTLAEGDDDSEDMPDPEMMSGDGGNDPTADPDADPNADPSMAADDGSGGMDDDPTAGGSLHDRLSKLESHTGLKKSAKGSISERLDLLEEDILGDLYDGPSIDRLMQLEKSVGITAAKPEVIADPEEPEIEAPETIDLGNLIKAAIAEANDKFAATLDEKLDRKLAAFAAEDEDLPDSEVMRKAAKMTQFGKRKSQPNSIQSDDALTKSVMSSWAGEDLDAPATFGDALMIMTRADRGGYSLFGEEELDDLSD